MRRNNFFTFFSARFINLFNFVTLHELFVTNLDGQKWAVLLNINSTVTTVVFCNAIPTARKEESRQSWKYFLYFRKDFLPEAARLSSTEGNLGSLKIHPILLSPLPEIFTPRSFLQLAPGRLSAGFMRCTPNCGFILLNQNVYDRCARRRVIVIS